VFTCTEIINNDINDNTTPSGIGTYYTEYTVIDDAVPPNTVTITETIIVIDSASGGGGNTAPNANAGPDQTVNENTLVTLTGAASSDTDGTIVSYAWARTNNGGQDPVLSDSTAVSPTFTAPDVPPSGRTYEYTLTVTDNLGATGTDIVVITVNDGVGGGNTAPNAGVDISFSVSDDTVGVILNGSGATDVEDDAVPIALTYAWTKTGGPGGSNNPAIVNPSNISPTFTAPSVSGQPSATTVLEFTLTVTDSQGATDTKLVTVTVTND
jgi:hypothetical protein